MEQATNRFCTAELSLPHHLRARHGVVSGEAFLVTEDARAAAAHLLAQARAQAEDIREQARADAMAALRDEQGRIAREAGELLERLREREAVMLDGVAGLAIELAQSIYERLLVDTIAQERVAAACRRVREEAPPKLIDAVAWLHPDDVAGLAQEHGLPWEVRGDARLAPGSCRLEAASGEWRAEFALAAEALRAALSQWMAGSHSEPDETEEGDGEQS
ncbi:flagellar biosynthesis/type III secretory pathway protein [Herbaspirillum sp. LeCh32-8]|uniref:HrpE/YscL family type III secretion apparatus protein n=1 Tax=Herbaspirillum sp. LeCh32-8 TaxID=2821356 RepID=UPI001AE11368|nr:flagellar biosynthesis/type III secretory pathway protein [Herbaspirillum sp. LeCh32-8]